MTMSDGVQVGLPVYTLDGEMLGEVKAIDRNYFQVAAAKPGQMDFWLNIGDVVTSTEAGRVTVEFEHEHLEERKAGSAGLE